MLRRWPPPACPPSPPSASASLPVTPRDPPACNPPPPSSHPPAHPHAHTHAHAHSHSHSQTAAAPVNIPAQALSPPTPAPSPTPTERWAYAALAPQLGGEDHDEPESADKRLASALMTQFRGLPQTERFAFLSSLVGELQLSEALAVSSKISPRLKRDFLTDLPVELALHCVSFIDDPRTLASAMRVCKYWHDLLQDERLWREMHTRQLFRPKLSASHTPQPPPSAAYATTTQSRLERGARPPRNSAAAWGKRSLPKRSAPQARSYREKFRDAYLTENNWLSGGRLLTMHCSMGDSVVTSLVVNEEYIVIGMANSKIHVFDAGTGHYVQSLLGHEQGVWALVLVSPHARSRTAVPLKRQESVRRASFTGTRASAELSSDTVPVYRSTSSNGSERSPSNSRATKRLNSSDVCGAAASWSGIKRTLVVSGGCDREVRVWDILTGEPVWTLQGHSSTIRCLKVLDGRPIAISGSRDYTLRVWDIDRGRMLRVLEGHSQSVRCLEVAGNQVVSGSYDYTCRLWDIDTGECLQVFRGHYHQIYAVAFDGERVVSGSLDSTVRVWDAGSGECLAILQGHTSLVGQLQLSGDRLITGGSDGRVIVFDLNDYSCVHRLCAHDNSVTCLQFDDRFIVSGGNDGRVKLWDIHTGTFIRELTSPCEAVWRVCFRDDKCAILCQRNGRTVLEVLGFRPQDETVRASYSRTPDW
ncbi:WD40 repeat-like protein [Cutaneotrichosporon oleaginosum]|uniref:WD40 repeat-like protein n=1 Tax=Cutaneotrichosporon oleaginosum TaxID=879819 RepID=A0A0J0XQ74_9TREE|nr:WD40 repeat-like protein [Cutaneotrichosporon oleaginosum]KLT43227.1 WD40 repeat-like protein [Cutaneotrichosporon oleaginosum]TXT09908.1 hypothetical protein COLE_03842 [Cutaneotrichosporon oleaginosum]